MSAATIGFLFHAPGLWLVGYRLGPKTLQHNLVALLATLVATIATYSFAGAWPALSVWLAGHFAWSAYLAHSITRGTAKT